MKRLLLACLLLSTLGVALIAPARAQDATAPPPDATTLLKVSAAPVTLHAGGSAAVTLKLVLAQGWHVYANPPSGEYNIPVKAALTGAMGVSAGTPHYPAGKDVKLPSDDKPTRVYDGAFEITLPLQALASATNGKHTLKGKVSFQSCNDQVCLPPASVPFTVDVTVDGGAAPGAVAANDTVSHAPVDSAASPRAPADTAAATGQGFMTAPPARAANAPASDDAIGQLEGALRSAGLGAIVGVFHGTFGFVLLLFLGGLALNLTPCVFPMLGITVSIFGARRKEALPKVIANALAYVLGISVMYTLLGVVAALTGGLFGSALQNPLVSIGLGVLFIVLSLSMFGVYEMQAPGWMLDKLGGANTASIAGVFLSGLAVGVVAAPCIGPIVLAVLAIIAQRANVGFGMTTMFTMSIGLGFPYLFLAVFSNLLQSLPRSGEWMDWVKKVFGVILASWGLNYILVGLVPHFAHWVLPTTLVLGGLYLGFMEKSANRVAAFRLFKRIGGTVAVIAGVLMSLSLVRASHAELAFRPYSDSALKASLASGHGVMLDFSAEWCAACHELEQKTFPDPAVRAAAANIDAYRVDLTHFDSPEADTWRQKYNIKGLPTIVFLKPDGTEAPGTRVTGFMPPAEFVKVIEKAK
jgi:thiol:disulfide interchange protein DsbD